jgi:hypothetical protein
MEIPRHGLGTIKKAFSDEQQFEMAQFIHEKLIALDQFFDDSDFQPLARLRFAEHILTADPEADFDQFKDLACSPRFIAGFKRKHCLCSRMFHCKPRPESLSQESLTMWLRKMCCFLKTVGNVWIINCDENFWLLWSRGLLTWSETGAKSVQVRIANDEKAPITAIASVTASGFHMIINTNILLWIPV